jgi:polar amino acid transport system substrate-binding protein
MSVLSGQLIACPAAMPLRSLLAPVIASGLLLGQSAAQACLLRVRQHSDPLVLTRLPGGELSGPQVETIREAARRIGCRIETLPWPWARALIELEAGRLDLLPEAHRAPEREAYAWFSTSTWPINTRVYMRVDQLRRGDAPRSLTAFLAQRLRLGVQVDARYGGETDRLLADPRHGTLLVRAANRQGLWQMLAMGRIDGVLATEHAGSRELPPLGLQERIAASPIRIDEDPTHAAFSRVTVSRELVARFDAAIETMRSDGSAAAIERRFRQSD